MSDIMTAVTGDDLKTALMQPIHLSFFSFHLRIPGFSCSLISVLALLCAFHGFSRYPLFPILCCNLGLVLLPCTPAIPYDVPFHILPRFTQASPVSSTL